MATTTQLPVYETVCVKTEEKLVGWRDLTAGEIAEEEAFSSGVPSFGFDYANALASLHDPAYSPPGYIVTPPPGAPPVDLPPVPIPGAIFLFGAAAAIYVIVKTVRGAFRD